LSEVGSRLVPGLGPERVVRKPLDLFGHALFAQPFKHRHAPSVQHAAPLLEKTAIRNLVGKGMLEGVFDLREGGRLVDELGGL